MDTSKYFKNIKFFSDFYGVLHSDTDVNKTRILTGYYIDPIKALSILFPGSLTIGIILEHEEDIYKWDSRPEEFESDDEEMQ